jgi:hypothetical protein
VWVVHAPGEKNKIKSQAIPREVIEKFDRD